MFIELVSSLRCLTPHEDNWLVVATGFMADRSIVEGRLGCPVCRREYPIAGGVAYFGVAPAEPVGVPNEAAPAAAAAPADDEDGATRLAALLDLAAPGGVVVLAGAWGRAAPALAALATVHCLVVDPPGDGRTLVGEGVSVLRSAGAMPLARGSVRGVALDADAARERTLAGAARALASRGRLVAPAAATLPPDLAELARDQALVVAERRPVASAPVGIGVVRRGR